MRRLLLAVAACVLGLLPGIPSLAQTGSGPKDYPPNLIVQSTGAPDEQLNVAAGLDRGTRPTSSSSPPARPTNG
jgi:hypothetical protein